jgi:DNA repair photolyase
LESDAGNTKNEDEKMLGELYYPKGKAKETASRVLDVEEPMACNVAYGCRNCKYCYIPYIKKGQIRFPKVPPIDLVKKQLDDGLKPKGVFLSFTTDPFLKENEKNTKNLIELLLEKKIRVATLSKIGVPDFKHLCKTRTGMTIVSDSEEFRRKFEPNAISIGMRITALKTIYDMGGFTWVSLEPYPTPAIWKQEIEKLLDKINFVDFMVFGRWNYEKLANDKPFYVETIKKFEDYCNQMGIKYFVKMESR